MKVNIPSASEIRRTAKRLTTKVKALIKHKHKAIKKQSYSLPIAHKKNHQSS